jgi:hypothetical protein
VARKRKNPHETQAKLGALLAAVGLVCAAALTAGVFWHFDFKEFIAFYKMPSIRFYGIAGAALLGLACGAVGFFVSLNAAGQKRNELSGLAWKAFFANAFVLLVTLCVGVVFFFAKQAV